MLLADHFHINFFSNFSAFLQMSFVNGNPEIQCRASSTKRDLRSNFSTFVSESEL